MKKIKKNKSSSKIIIIILALLLLCLGVIIVMSRFTTRGDSYEKFKEKYESVNGKKDSHGNIRRKVNISKNNVFYETNIKEVAKMIKNKETFYLYTGDEDCPWCRATIESADEVSRGLNIDKIYYLQLWDDDHNELFRDEKIITADKKIERVTEISDDYKVLLDSTIQVLKKYELFDSDGNMILDDEYRVYGANYFYFYKGKLKRFTTSITKSLTDKFMEMTDEIKEEQKEEYKRFFGSGDTCSDVGC